MHNLGGAVCRPLHNLGPWSVQPLGLLQDPAAAAFCKKLSSADCVTREGRVDGRLLQIRECYKSPKSYLGLASVSSGAIGAREY
eukprot:293961-Chlamydomonas_euryale.AAC.3